MKANQMRFNFRKACILMAATTCCYTGMAQQRRVCDLEVVCTSPAGTVINGNALPLKFETSNHGPDKMISGDRIIYMLYMVVDGQQKVIHSDIIGGYGNDSLDFGVKIVYGAETGAEVNFNLPDREEPFTLDFCVQIFSEAELANGDSIVLNYYDPNKANNINCQKITVMPKGGTSIGSRDMDVTGLLVYPNPASNILYVRTGYADAEELLLLTIRDITGRTMVEQRYAEGQAADGILSLNVEQLPVGIYNVSLQSNKGITTRKLTISR